MTRFVMLGFGVSGIVLAGLAVLAFMEGETKAAGLALITAAMVFWIALPELFPSLGAERPSTQWGAGALFAFAASAFDFFAGRSTVEWLVLLVFGVAAATRAFMLRKRDRDR